jgi:hypothetical protein
MIEPKYGMALITGASGGIGAAFARLLSAGGWSVILVGRDRRKLETTMASLHGPAAKKSTMIVADLSAQGAAQSLHSACRERSLAVELLINNAGSGLFGLCHELSIEKTEAMLGLNIVALSSLCALFARDMGAAGGGRILNVGSLAGNFALPYFAAYAASKSYVLSFSLALRAELKKSGIGVSCLLPGYVKTGFDEAAGITSPAYRSFSESAGMSADAVAKAGLSALDADRPFTVAGFGNKAAALFGRLLPRSAMPALVKPFLDRMISANAADEHGSRS